MPKKPMDYSRTIIYQICCKDLLVTDKYIGHTTDFTKRKCQHKNNYNNTNIKHYNQKVYQTIRDNGNWDNWEMIEIEKYPCNDANEARARERYWYEYYKATLNTQVPNRSKKEWIDINKNNIAKYRKEYSETNKEKITEKNICECGGNYTYKNKSRHLKSPNHINYFSSKLLGCL